MRGVGLKIYAVLVAMASVPSAVKELLTLCMLMVLVWAIWNSSSLAQRVKQGSQMRSLRG